MDDVIVSITSFNPLTVTLPDVQAFVGHIRIALPAVHLKVYDLSMGGILPGAHIGADAPVFGVNFTLPAPGMTTGEMYAFIGAARNELQAMWRIAQEELDKHGALL